MKKFYTIMLAVGFLTMGALEVNGSATVDYQPPQFISADYEISVAEDTNAVFSFYVIGSPTPTVEVFKDGKKIDPSKSLRYRLSYDNGKIVFIIYWVVPEDAGHYTFVAKNTLGTASRTVTLYVREWI